MTKDALTEAATRIIARCAMERRCKTTFERELRILLGRDRCLSKAGRRSCCYHRQERARGNFIRSVRRPITADPGKKELCRSKELAGKVAGTAGVDKMTDGQIAAKVRSVFACE